MSFVNLGKRTWQTMHVPKLGHEGLRMLPINKTSLLQFEVWVDFISGSNEFIVGAFSKPASDAESMLCAHTDTFCGVVFGRNVHASWTSLTTALPQAAATSHMHMQFDRGMLRFFVGADLHSEWSCPNQLSPCVMTVWEDTELSVKFRSPQSPRNCIPLGQNFGRQLHTSRKFTDAVVKCGDREFNVHRAILACGSEVFDRMFSSSMQEGSEAKVSIEDASPVAVEAMIRVLYTGELPEAALLPAVYSLAKKYMMSEITLEIGDLMLKELDETTAADIARTIRQHASGDDESSELWERLLGKLFDSKDLLSMVLADAYDNPCRSAMLNASRNDSCQ